jgi:RNA polymerase sigma-70 factor (ECF subfamily)
MHTPDHELAVRAQAGDRAAFGELYDRYAKDIYAFAYWRLYTREAAEDATSDIFMKALTALPRYRVDAGTFKAWLYTIARNTVIDLVRSRKPTVELEDAIHVPETESSAHRLGDVLDAARVLPYLKALSDEQRDIVILRVWHDLSHKEIARVLRMSEASSKMGFSRAIKRLRETLPADAFALLLATLLIPPS